MAKSYCYPGSNVLINKLDIKDPVIFAVMERRLTAARLAQLQVNPIDGYFDLKHMQSIHKHIFQDMYTWAGELRMLDISKNGTSFMPCQFIKPYSDQLFSKLNGDNYLCNLDIDTFSKKFSYYTAEINIMHPFREGNGRTTREFIRCLANEAGYTIDYSKMNKDELLKALIKSTDEITDLQRVIKNNIIENIKEKYTIELTSINNAPESLLNKLHEINNSFPDRDFCSIKDIKEIYKELGSKVEEGSFNPDNSTFKLFSDTIIEIRRLQSCNINKETHNIDSSKNNNLNIEL